MHPGGAGLAPGLEVARKGAGAGQDVARKGEGDRDGETRQRPWPKSFCMSGGSWLGSKSERSGMPPWPPAPP